MLSYVDTSKVCVWGWSFGGYLTGLLLAEVMMRIVNIVDVIVNTERDNDSYDNYISLLRMAISLILKSVQN